MEQNATLQQKLLLAVIVTPLNMKKQLIITIPFLVVGLFLANTTLGKIVFPDEQRFGGIKTESAIKPQKLGAAPTETKPPQGYYEVDENKDRGRQISSATTTVNGVIPARKTYVFDGAFNEQGVCFKVKNVNGVGYTYLSTQDGSLLVSIISCE